MTPSDIFDEINSRLQTDASRAAGIDAICNFNVSGDEGGDYHVVVHDGQCEAGPGLAENPNITVSLKDKDLVDLRQGKLNAASAFVTGKLKIKGDMGLAMKLAGLLR